MTNKMINKEILSVFSLSFIFLIIGLFMLNYRWINPDEGAHLSDAILLLEGKIPKVDYSSRQPFYTLLAAIFIKIFGVSFLGGRALPLLSSIGVSVLIYLIAKKLFNRDVALTSQFIYIFLPFTILFSSIAKMENVVIFWECLGILFYINFWGNKKLVYLVLSGLALGLAYYVRESSLALFLTVAVTIILTNGKNISITIKHLSIFLVGFFSIAFIAFIFYLNYKSFNEIWHSSVNPFWLILKGFPRIISFFAATGSAVTDSTQLHKEIIVTREQDMSRSIHEVKEVLKMNLFLALGFVFFLVYYLKKLFSGDFFKKNKSIGFYILPVWVITLVLIYGYHLFDRAFYPQYATEFFPPLIICFGYVVSEKLLKEKKIINGTLLFFLGLSFSAFAINKIIFKKYPEWDTCLIISIFFVSIYWFSREGYLKRNRKFLLLLSLASLFIIIMFQLDFIKDRVSGEMSLIFTLTFLYTLLLIAIRKGAIGKERFFSRFVAIPTVVAALMFSFSVSSLHLKMSYDGCWSPRSVKIVERYLKENSVQGDTLLSGSMIWAVNPKIRPFRNLTHPLAFVMMKEDNSFMKRLKNDLQQSPLTYIIMDGYTEKCYSAIENYLNNFVAEQYQKVLEISETKYSRYPIIIYKLKTLAPKIGQEHNEWLY